MLPSCNSRGEGWGGGWGGNVCVTLSDSLQSSKEGGGGGKQCRGWRTNKALDEDFDKINFID